ncbi:MAG: AIM24 family protein [Planctomycetaceae bacterium]|nr:AIM24 family protein [Planctomycetaceae bacterium]
MSDSIGARYDLETFVQVSQQKDRNEGVFELESDRMLKVNLNNSMIWTKLGAMVAYRGNLKFTREGIFDQGLGNLLKKMVSSEGARLTKVEGTGKLYAADQGKKITIIQLRNQGITVNANDVLAFEPTLTNKIVMMRKIASMMAGGLFNIQLSGTGLAAITTHFDPLILIVKPGEPACTDPNATVAWSSNLSPQFKTDMSFRTFIGRGSGETFQMLFEGNGFVVIQPFEEFYGASS